jgi:hypothetical protein
MSADWSLSLLFGPHKITELGAKLPLAALLTDVRFAGNPSHLQIAVLAPTHAI